MSSSPVDGAELDLVVGIDFHQEPLSDVTVEAPDCKIGIVGYALDGRRVLHAGERERERERVRVESHFLLSKCLHGK